MMSRAGSTTDQSGTSSQQDYPRLERQSFPYIARLLRRGSASTRKLTGVGSDRDEGSIARDHGNVEGLFTL